MKAKKTIFFSIFMLTVIALLIFITGCVTKKPEVILLNQRGNVVQKFKIFDSLLVGAKTLTPQKRYVFEIVRGDKKITSSVFMSNKLGNIPAIVLWYDIGVDYDLSGNGRLKIKETIGEDYRLVVREQKKQAFEIPFEVHDLKYIPRVYTVDENGNIRSGFRKNESDIYLVGENFPPGSDMRVYLVKAQRTWGNEEKLEDVTSQYKTIQLEERIGSFKILLSARDTLEIGSYDVVIDFFPMDGHYSHSQYPEASDAIWREINSGFVLFSGGGIGHIEQEMACQAPPHDPNNMAVYGAPNPIYRDNFSADEEVWMTIDPYFQGNNLVGKKARVYVVQSKTAQGWDADTSLNDVDGLTGWDETTIQPGCANVNYVPVWLNPSPGDYDVVMDFQLPDGTFNGVYDKGVDIIDMADDMGFNVPNLWVTLDQIKFNHNTSSNQNDAITIKQNGSTGISAPEWTKTGIAKPAAYVKDKSIVIRARFTAHSSVTSAKIKANGGGVLGDLGEITVTFSGGISDFFTFTPANKIPNYVGYKYITWNWKYRDVNNSGYAETEAATSRNKIYIVYADPQSPMTVPWVDGVLEKACSWANNESVEADIVAELTDGAFYSTGKTYFGGNSHSPGSTFYLTSFLSENWADCRDMSAYLHVLCRAVGVAPTQMLRIQGLFDTKPILPIGNTSWGSTSWNFHRVGYYLNKVYDACLKLNQSSPVIPKSMNVNGNYKSGLYDSGTWNPLTPFDITTIY